MLFLDISLYLVILKVISDIDCKSYFIKMIKTN